MHKKLLTADRNFVIVHCIKCWKAKWIWN